MGSTRGGPTQAIAHVDSGGSTLEDAKGLDDGRRHAILRLVDAEVLEGALRLGAPVLVGLDMKLAKGIGLGSDVGSHDVCGAVEASTTV